MFLVRLIYASEAVESFNLSGAMNIVEKAMKNNERMNVTGMLCVNHKYFLQCLEGDRIAVNEIYQKIMKDERHTQITLLEYDAIDEREFPSWSMGFASQSAIHQGLNLKYSVSDKFNPFEMTGASCHAFMSEISKTLKKAQST